MKTRNLFAFAALAAFGLVACDEKKPEAAATTPAPKKEEIKPAEPPKAPEPKKPEPSTDEVINAPSDAPPAPPPKPPTSPDAPKPQ